MPDGTEFSHLDLRSALDFAIGIEEDAQLRYQEFATLVTDGDAATFFAEMVRSEARHRRQLEARRDVLFGKAPRFDTSLIGHSEGADPAEVTARVSLREAMGLALEAETRALEFYRSAIPELKDAGVRALFEHLHAEEVEHQAAVRRMLAGLAT